MKLFIVSFLGICLFFFQNCEVITEAGEDGNEKTYILDSVSIDGNLSDISFVEFSSQSQESSLPIQTFSEYRVDPDSGEVSVFNSGSKSELCMTDAALTKLQLFIATRKLCVKTLVQNEADPVMCTMEYRYGMVVFNLLEPQVANMISLNVEGTNGCLVDVDFCSDRDRNDFIKIKGDIKMSPPGSCE